MAKKRLAKKFVVLIVVGSVLTALLAAILGLVVYAHRIDDYAQPGDVLSYWMDYIADDALVKKIAIAGSHDSGTYGMFYMSETQDRTVFDQLRSGVRYLDVRVGLKKGAYKVFHGPIYGVEYETVLQDIVAFLTAHPTETLFLDLQHFGDGAKEGTLSLTEQYLAPYFLKNESGLSDVAFIDALTLGQARGKVVVFVGEDDGTVTAQNRYFKRNDDLGSLPDCALQSYYIEKFNKGNAKKYVEECLADYIARYKAVNSGLFVLQGQLTDGTVVLGPRFRESKHCDRMNAYVQFLSTSPDLAYVNVVMRDYVTPHKCALTIRLNLAKSLVKPARAEEFSALLA